MLRFDRRSGHYLAEADLILFRGDDGYAPIDFAISSEALEELSGERFERCPMELFSRWRTLVFQHARGAYLRGDFEPAIGIVVRAGSVTTAPPARVTHHHALPNAPFRPVARPIEGVGCGFSQGIPADPAMPPGAVSRGPPACGFR